MADHKCPTCGRADFAREVDMKAHHMREHGVSLVEEGNPRKCPTCGRADFAREVDMKAHHMREHGESIAESRSIAQSTRQIVLERDSNQCQRCGAEITPKDEAGADFQLHHIIPVAAGGANKPDNLVTLCNDCHMRAHQQMKTLPEEYPDLLDELRTIICDMD